MNSWFLRVGANPVCRSPPNPLVPRGSRRSVRLSLLRSIAMQCDGSTSWSAVAGGSFCDDHTVCPWDKVNRGEPPDDVPCRGDLTCTPCRGIERTTAAENAYRPSPPPSPFLGGSGFSLYSTCRRPTCPRKAAFATAQMLCLEEGLWPLLPSPSRFTLLVPRKNIRHSMPSWARIRLSESTRSKLSAPSLG